MALPPPPARAFASDNAAGAHPAIVDAVVRANDGHALAYGDDAITGRCEQAFDDLFDRSVATLLTFNGTGANVMALTTLARPGDAVICSAGAHINVDETGAPERIAGTKLIDLPAPDGRLLPEQIDEQAEVIGVQHHAQPTLISITQSTELGTLYTVDEIAALCDTAHRHGMTVHMDGARIANAVAALGGSVETLRDMTVRAGVDVLTFGGTKNGLLGGEAVVFFDPERARRARFVRKTVTQLPSKMRFIAAQFEALLTDGLWITLADHANRMAGSLFEATRSIPGVALETRPVVNSVFPVLPAAAIEPLRDWCFFWDWNPGIGQVRWMTAWDTTQEDVERFAAGARHILASCN
jgi:threonine aldolase